MELDNEIILIGNYLPDNLESMNRFCTMMGNTLAKKNLKVRVLLPTVFFGKFFKNTNRGFGKWLAYIDKYIIFPFVLIYYSIRCKFSSKKCVFHICDHSNAMYAFFLPKSMVVITCHDMLAIRGSMGFTDSYCESTATGKILQKWIFYSLKKIRRIAFVSNFTLGQFKDLAPNNQQSHIYKLVYNSFNENFYPIPFESAVSELEEFPILINSPFVLHVGSGHPRKNRKMLIEFLIRVKDSWSGNLCFVGEDLDAESLSLVKKHDLIHRIIVLKDVNKYLLLALYRLCDVFMFPSFSEGFGWPVIEAQACGSPIVTSSIEPMPEIAGENSLRANPNIPEEFVDAFNYLQDSSNRKQNIDNGFVNIKRFDLDLMIDNYLELYFSYSNV
jgi:glycosyltransferase involved in cell wall biosynthesis